MQKYYDLLISLPRKKLSRFCEFIGWKEAYIYLRDIVWFEAAFEDENSLLNSYNIELFLFEDEKYDDLSTKDYRRI